MAKTQDWQIVTICDGFVIEVDCNSGSYRRVYADGRIDLIEAAKRRKGD